MRGTRVLVAVLVLAVACQGSGRTIVVPQDYASVQAAIDAGQAGDTIVVQPGTYQESIVFGGKDLMLRSQDPNDPAIVAATILRAPVPKRSSTAPTVVTFANGESRAAVLSGFTITGGGGTAFPESPGGSFGGGILCAMASPTITLNVITGNLVSMRGGTNGNGDYGGGIGCFDSNAVITRNVLRGNTAYAGGAIMIEGGTPLVANNLIYDNTAVAGGGACLVYGGVLANNTMLANQGEAGGNVYVVTDIAYGGPCRIVNNLLCDARGSQGLYREGSHPDDRIAFNNVWSSTDGADTGWIAAAGAGATSPPIRCSSIRPSATIGCGWTRPASMRATPIHRTSRPWMPTEAPGSYTAGLISARRSTPAISDRSRRSPIAPPRQSCPRL